MMHTHVSLNSLPGWPEINSLVPRKCIRIECIIQHSLDPVFARCKQIADSSLHWLHALSKLRKDSRVQILSSLVRSVFADTLMSLAFAVHQQGLKKKLLRIPFANGCHPEAAKIEDVFVYVSYMYVIFRMSYRWGQLKLHAYGARVQGSRRGYWQGTFHGANTISFGKPFGT